MNRLIALLCVVTLWSLTAPVGNAEEKGFVPMFNGQDLTGWEGQPGAWRVEDGTITGESTVEKPCERTHYLYWQGGEPADFVMRAEIKLVGGNSGIQFRSAKRPQFDTFGYQADYDASQALNGCLYQHQRGAVAERGQRVAISKDGKRQIETFATAAELAKKFTPNDWNEYEIVAKGSKIVLKLNGELMSEVDDQDEKMSRRQGVIALQMHQGPPMKVQFRNLRIKVLD